jgi:hypothetical protein
VLFLRRRMNVILSLNSSIMTSKTAHKMFKVFCNVHFCMFLFVYDLFHICCRVTKLWIRGMCVCITTTALHKVLSGPL